MLLMKKSCLCNIRERRSIDVKSNTSHLKFSFRWYYCQCFLQASSRQRGSLLWKHLFKVLWRRSCFHFLVCVKEWTISIHQYLYSKRKAKWRTVIYNSFFILNEFLHRQRYLLFNNIVRKDTLRLRTKSSIFKSQAKSRLNTLKLII